MIVNISYFALYNSTLFFFRICVTYSNVSPYSPYDLLCAINVISLTMNVMLQELYCIVLYNLEVLYNTIQYKNL